MAALLALLQPTWAAFSRLLSSVLRRAAVTVELENRYGTADATPTVWRESDGMFLVWMPFRFRVLNHSPDRQVRIARVNCELPHSWRYERQQVRETPAAALGEAIRGGDFSPWIDCSWIATGKHKSEKLPKSVRVSFQIVGGRTVHKRIRLLLYATSGAEATRTFPHPNDPADGLLRFTGATAGSVHHYELRKNTQGSCDLSVFMANGSLTRFPDTDWDRASTFITNDVRWWEPLPIVVTGDDDLRMVISGLVLSGENFGRILRTVLRITGCVAI